MGLTAKRLFAAVAVSGAGLGLVAFARAVHSQRIAEPKGPEISAPAARSAKPAPRGSSASSPAPLDTRVWRVPVYDDDPVKGPADALVTVVEFSEFESAFCERARSTLDELLRVYPRDVRLVWKDHPLHFDARAKPAAALARFAYARGGNQAFWRAHDELFALRGQLADDALQALAGKLGLPWVELKSAIDHGRFTDKFDQSIELAGDVKARGIPHFFVNGRRLAGAQSLEAFKRLVDVELARAKELVARGIASARVYAEIIKSGEAPPPLVQKDVPEPDAKSPFRGEARSPLAIQEFARFPCGDCEHVSDTLRAVEAEYRGRVRTVFRYVLPDDGPRASLVAQAAQEVFEQGGSAAFWTYHERVLDAELRGPVDQATLERIATQTGVDATRLRQALLAGKHRGRVTRDAELARKIGVSKGPAFVVGGYFLVDDPSGPAFKKVINRSLRERARAVKLPD